MTGEEFLNPKTDLAAALAAAAKPQVEDLKIDAPLAALLPPGWSAQMLYDERVEKLQERPKRAKGTVHAYDAPSFIAAVRARAQSAVKPVLYANEDTNELSALLNDDAGDQSGWRDYRVSLLLRPTPEWKHWKARDGQLVGQETFAEHIEDGLAELQDPPAADMLDLAQTFQAVTQAGFKQGQRLASGQVQFRYEETIDAKAGTSGTIQIPERLTLAMAPFIGSARYEIKAWFRYRLNREQFKLGYKLDRPHDIERAAFADILTLVTSELSELVTIAGPAPGN